ncbi:MarR family winged helix-turn-helix transcriptional regulator [Rhizorhabdus dicambivorans]|uniref:MarR family transcriptional regulator n=1 Tax=Rhizorhabdus dicambivorans TaxID=1850238 RepID=A0A2A4FT73_9SPHN|nr:MarR family transcriptional regulator [Rhizorhabdus dicambivorans]ATE65602.1 MarR family transcriptional regulator [Rhizorhabdus dicambivorans]PCE41945.1 MarR family transcriptional regulator [Rhizorhabdus dicambivorans]
MTGPRDQIDARTVIERYKSEFPELQPHGDGAYAGSMWHIMALAHQIIVNLDVMLRERKLSAADIFVMSVIFIEGDGRARPSDVARVLSVTPAAISLRIAKLADKGFIVREAAGGDRRTAKLSLTAEAAALVRGVLADISVNSGFARSIARLSTEKRVQLESLLSDVATEMARHVVTE